MCALRHLIFNRVVGDELIKSNIKQLRASRIRTRKQKILKMVADLHHSQACSKCGANTNYSYITFLPPIEVRQYIEMLVDNKLPMDIQCCKCMTKFCNNHYINANDIKELAIHGTYWRNICPKSTAPILILPRPPDEKILAALENMYYLPEGAECFPIGEDVPVNIVSPIEMEVNGDQFIIVNPRRGSY